MDKIFHSTFDFFSHALPGFCMALGFYILDSSLNTPHDFLIIAKSLKLESVAFLLLIGYVLGFGLFPIGNFLYKTVGKKIWKKEISHNVDLFISDKYVLIRELSPSNFKYVEIWNMYCALAHNLAMACLLIFVFSWIKIISLAPPNPFLWVGFSFVIILFFFLFLNRAVVFSIWAANDLNAAIRQLKLEEQGKNILEIKRKV